MVKTLLEELPSIFKEGKNKASQIMDRLDGKNPISLQNREVVIPSRASNWLDMLKEFEKNEAELDYAKMNRLIYGDNLLAIMALLAGNGETPSYRGKVNLIYIDPPFDSGTDYRTKIKLPKDKVEQKPTAIEQVAYSDTWENSTASYLQMLIPRLILMRELLADTGSLYVHCDWHVGHYIKIILDEIFGKQNFRNDIVWNYGGRGGKAVSSQFPRNYDSIMFFTKNKEATFEKQSIINKIKFKGSGYKIDEEGKCFRTSPRGHYTDESVKQLAKEGRIYRTATGNIRIKYFEEYDGEYIYEKKWIEDVWADIQDAMHTPKSERLGYPTQKPEALLQRIIKTSSNKGDIVADFFAGSGSTAAVAEKLNRRWIVGDLGKPACMVTRKRLIDNDAQPFLYQHIGDYQIEQMRSTMGRKYTIGDLAQIIVELYGAIPLDGKDANHKNMGQIPKDKTLVYVDSPSNTTGKKTLQKAIDYRNNLTGAWDKVVVLGWHFSPFIVSDIRDLKDKKLEVLVIPPDLLDRIKKKGDKLQDEGVRFATLQCVNLKNVGRNPTGKTESLQVELDDYILSSPEAINLKDKDRDKVKNLMDKDPLALIEYWSIDPDYDGECFRSVWQDYRGNTDRCNSDRVMRKATLAGLPKKDGMRKVCVRVVDIFGFEAEEICEV